MKFLSEWKITLEIEERSKLMKKETEDFSKIKAKKNILKTKRFEQKIKS